MTAQALSDTPLGGPAHQALAMEYALLIEDHPMMSDAVGSSLWRWLPGLQLLRAYSLGEAQTVLQGASPCA